MQHDAGREGGGAGSEAGGGEVRWARNRPPNVAMTLEDCFCVWWEQGDDRVVVGYTTLAHLCTLGSSPKRPSDMGKRYGR